MLGLSVRSLGHTGWLALSSCSEEAGCLGLLKLSVSFIFVTFLETCVSFSTRAVLYS